MRPNRKFILTFAALSFLTMTLSGLHLHADVGEHDASVSHEHDLHQAFSDDLDHEGEHVDISVFEPARGFSQLETVAPAFVLPELIAQPVIEISWSQDSPRLEPRRYFRLRQPVRAPPVSA